MTAKELAIAWVEDNNVFLRNIEGEKCLAKNWISLWGNIYRRKPEERRA